MAELENTYKHPEPLMRSELPAITKACARRRLKFAFQPVPGAKNEWRVYCPADQEDELLKALKDAGV